MEFERIDIDKMISEFFDESRKDSQTDLLIMRKKIINSDDDCPCCNLKELFEK